MTRVKRGKITIRIRKKRTLKAKGFRGAWSVLSRPMLQNSRKALNYSYTHRNKKFSTNRRLWITRINASIRASGIPITYNQFIYNLNTQKCKLNRNTFSQLAIRDNLTFLQLVKFYFSL